MKIRNTKTATPITFKQVLLFPVLPVCISIALLFYAFHLKQQEMISYQSPGWRIAIIVVASALGALSLFIFWMAMQVRLLDVLKVKYTSKSPAASIVIGLGTLLVILPIIYLGFRLKQYNDAIEEKALAQHGITTKAVVTRFKKVRRKYKDHYRIYITFMDQSGMMIEESYKQKQLTLKAGDTVPVVYLDINPNVFRIVE